MRRSWNLSVLLLLVPFVVAGAGVATYLGAITPAVESVSPVHVPATVDGEAQGDQIAGDGTPTNHAINLLARLPRAGEPIDGYERSSFGPGWGDPDRNGCDTRNDMLARDLKDVVFKPGTHDCVVLMGTLDDPYTGSSINFVKGQGTSELVQIDHIVPMSWAWQYGAEEWVPAQRELFANDPANLLAVDGFSNQSKSDKGPSGWLPIEVFRCDYAEKWVGILTKYELAVPATDRLALHNVLLDCG